LDLCGLKPNCGRQMGTMRFSWRVHRVPGLDKGLTDKDGPDSEKELAGSLGTPLQRAFPDPIARVEFLNATRSEMYTCLELFYSHVKGVVSLMLGLVTGIAALVGLVSHVSTGNSNELAAMSKIGAVSVLMLMLPFAIISSIILARYCRLYVAALLFAADLHRNEGITGHSWLDEIERYRTKLGPNAANNELLIRKRTYSWPHTWSLYTLLLILIALAGFVFGIAIIGTL